MKVLLPLLLASVTVLSACGGGASDPAPSAASGSGNWQFTMAAPADNSFVGGIQGGFLRQSSAGLTGAFVYSISLPGPESSLPTICSSGSGPVTGTISSQSVTLNVTAGAQTFTLTGTLSSDGSTMSGTYDSSDGQGCGTAQNGLQWSAQLVPALTGSVQGNFHSVLSSVGLRDENFAVSGLLTQGPNIGASNATVTGTLVFQNYPCLDTASVNGQISGSSVILHIIGSDGLDAGQIGAASGLTNPNPVIFETSAGGNGAVIHGASGYGVSTKACPGGNLAGDIGNVCLALGNTTSCTQPLLIAPASLTFPAGGVGVSTTTQTVTITNNDPSGTTLTGLSLAFNPHAGSTSQFGLSDFTGLPNFTEQDTCADSLGATFSLATQQSCSVAISFSPQQSCPWLLSSTFGGVPPSACPAPLSATLTVNSPVSTDDDTAFAVPATGTGFSALVPSTPELDFSAEAVAEISEAQTLSFTNIGQSPVQILPSLGATCVNPDRGVLTLPRPLVPGSISGLQVDTAQITPDGSTIDYICDSDLTTRLPNFQITADACSGTLLAPQSSCSVQILFAPQPSTPLIPALDYFLELNTLQCASSVTSNCEIDSGRFPVELTANLPSPLRMSPSASLDFGSQIQGVATIVPLTLTIFNDPNDPDARTITFTSNLVKGDYKEVDNCAGTSLPPGSSCTFTVTFTPKIVGPDNGSITLTYPPAQTQIIHLRGAGTPVPAAIRSKLAKEAGR